LLFRGVEAATPIVQQGGAVVVHCHYGRHRSVALASCILIGQGYTAEDAMRLITQQRPAADPYAWYIRARIVRFAEQWT
jgi:protein-tyrosine phosphatase